MRLEVGERFVLVAEEGEEDLVEVDIPQEEGAGGSAIGRTGNLLRLDEVGGGETTNDLARILN